MSKSNNILQKHFGDSAGDLLQMEKSADLDGLLSSIQQFVGGEGGGDSVTTHQLRNIYDRVKPLKKGELAKLKMLRVQLAYIAARHKTMRNMVAVLDELIKTAKNDDDLRGFQQFMQALVAYQKYYEKMESPQKRNQHGAEE